MVGNEKLLYDALVSVHTIKGYPSALWVLIRKLKDGRQAGFYDLNEPQRIITITLHPNVNSLHQYKVFTWLPTNQAEIDKATDAGEAPPEPIKNMQVIQKLFWMATNQEKVRALAETFTDKIQTPQLIEVMKLVFPDYDDDQFKVHHMQRVWKWYLMIQKWYNALPEYIAPAEPETPAVEAAPKIEH